MKTKIKFYLLAAGTVVYAAGYLVLIAAVAIGQVSGLSGVAAVLMGTGILIALIVGLALTKVVGETIGEL